MRLLRWLLWLLPADFRREYRDELLSTVNARWRAMMREQRLQQRLGQVRHLSLARRLRFWVRQWLAVVRIAVNLRRGSGILGGADRHQRRRGSLVDGAWKDAQHVVRALRTRPGFTLVAVLTLGLGIGATTAMFSAVHSVLLRPLPYQDADHIVVVRQVDNRDGTLEEGVSAANLHDVAATAHSLSQASVAAAHGLRLMEDGRAFSLRSWLVSEGFFEALGTQALIGRTFQAEELTPGGEHVVLLSHATWQSRFGADTGIVGRELILDGAAYQVIGVLPADFEYPSAADIWAPRPVQPSDEPRRGAANLDGVARLAPGITAAQAQTELNHLATELAAAYPIANADLGFQVTPLRQHLLGDVELPLILLLGAVGLVLLIAAANVAGLQLARGAGRSREFALRGALGASSRNILRLVCVESLLLAAAGGLLGLGITYLGVDLIRLLGPDHVPRLDELRIDSTVLTFALLAATGSALLAGIAPALQASRDLQAALTEGARGSTGGPRTLRLRDRLVMAEIAVALVLAIGAGLLVRSFDRLLDNNLGFEPQGRLAVQVWAYDDNHQPQLDFFQRSREAIGTLPGVEAVGLTTNLPLADDQSILARSRTVRFGLAGVTAASDGDQPIAGWSAIDDGYSEAMGIPLQAGRTFSPRDDPQSSPVAMVNEAFVRRYFPNQDPLGQQLLFGTQADSSREIVGILGDVRRRGFDSESRAEIYLPLSQAPSAGLTFVIKTASFETASLETGPVGPGLGKTASITTTGDPTALIHAVQKTLRAVDPSQAIWAIRPMTNLMWDWTRQRRFNTALLAAFAVLALSLASIGVYGLMSFSVEQRVNELGIRRALGGNTRDILTMILRRGLKLVLTGVSLGLLGSLALTRLMQSLLYGIEPFDPLTFGMLAALVIVVAVLAAYLPARRATRVDPMVVLRSD